MNIDIEINKAELAHIREFLTAQRRGDAYNADVGDTVETILRRVGYSAVFDNEALGPLSDHKRGVCAVCGCTENDACPPGCSWADPSYETVCEPCADA